MSTLRKAEEVALAVANIRDLNCIVEVPLTMHFSSDEDRKRHVFARACAEMVGKLMEGGGIKLNRYVRDPIFSQRGMAAYRGKVYTMSPEEFKELNSSVAALLQMAGMEFAMPIVDRGDELVKAFEPLLKAVEEEAETFDPEDSGPVAMFEDGKPSPVTFELIRAARRALDRTKGKYP